MWRLAEPWWLGLLVLLPACAWLATRRRLPRGRTLALPTLRLLAASQPSWRPATRHAALALRLLALGLLVVGLARPQSGHAWSETTQRGVDIELLLDVSGSMQARDFYPKKRIEVAKEVLTEFVAKQQGNRVGLVVFAGRAFTHVPMTTDHNLITELIREIDTNLVNVDGTAIGDGVTAGLYRLKDKTRKSRVIVLLTDGENNTGRVDPMAAAQMARGLGVKIYAIGMGRPGRTLIPIVNPTTGQREFVEDAGVDEPTLKQMAKMTGGEYFRGTDEAGLMRIYDHIAALEKAEFVVRRSVQYNDQALWLMLPALFCLSLELLWWGSRWRAVGT